MDGKRKEINLAKLILDLSKVEEEPVSCNMIFERPFLMNTNTLHFSNNGA